MDEKIDFKRFSTKINASYLAQQHVNVKLLLFLHVGAEVVSELILGCCCHCFALEMFHC